MRRRGTTARRAARLEAANHAFDLTATPQDMTDNQLWSAVYRLQSRVQNASINSRDRLAEEFRPRIAELTAEQQRRRAS